MVEHFRQHVAPLLDPDLKSEILNAIMGALDAHTTMSKQALNSQAVQSGMKDILLNHARLWEMLPLVRSFVAPNVSRCGAGGSE